MKAVVRYHIKQIVRDRYLVELLIHELEVSTKYPDGIKYGLICRNIESGEYVLMDNHHPKGPHIHINEAEFKYRYLNDDQLIEDFKELVLKELGVQL